MDYSKFEKGELVAALKAKDEQLKELTKARTVAELLADRRYDFEEGASEALAVWTDAERISDKDPASGFRPVVIDRETKSPVFAVGAIVEPAGLVDYFLSEKKYQRVFRKAGTPKPDDAPGNAQSNGKVLLRSAFDQMKPVERLSFIRGGGTLRD
jgi:hypothetical protein